MAFSKSELDQTVFGDKRVIVYSCVADGASDTVGTGLKKVIYAHVTPKSMSSTNMGKYSFSGSSVVVSNIASGDEFYLTCYGR